MSAMTRYSATPVLVGWREWVTLPELGIGAIKAKIDTGARTSALHAYKVERFSDRGAPWVRLHVHPRQRDHKHRIVGSAPIIDERLVSDSGGHREKRVVIDSLLVIGSDRWRIELTVTDRDTMLFRLLLGRTALRGRLVVDPGLSFRLGRGEPLPGAEPRVRGA